MLPKLKRKNKTCSSNDKRQWALLACYLSRQNRSATNIKKLRTYVFGI